MGEQEGYLTVGLFEDGSPGEVFITISKEGSTIRGLMDSLAVMTSLALQYGVPIENLAAKFKSVRFEPHGFTSNPEIPQASSLVDYMFRWLELKFASKEPGTRNPSKEPGTQGPEPGRGRTARWFPASGSWFLLRRLHRPPLPGVRRHPRLRRGLPHLPPLRLQQVRVRATDRHVGPNLSRLAHEVAADLQVCIGQG